MSPGLGYRTSTTLRPLSWYGLLATLLVISSTHTTEVNTLGWGGVQPAPSESECRPFIEKALKEQHTSTEAVETLPADSISSSTLQQETHHGAESSGEADDDSAGDVSAEGLAANDSAQEQEDSIDAADDDDNVSTGTESAEEGQQSEEEGGGGSEVTTGSAEDADDDGESAEIQSDQPAADEGSAEEDRTEEDVSGTKDQGDQETESLEETASTEETEGTAGSVEESGEESGEEAVADEPVSTETETASAEDTVSGEDDAASTEAASGEESTEAEVDKAEEQAGSGEEETESVEDSKPAEEGSAEESAEVQEAASAEESAEEKEEIESGPQSEEEGEDSKQEEAEEEESTEQVKEGSGEESGEVKEEDESEEKESSAPEEEESAEKVEEQEESKEESKEEESKEEEDASKPEESTENISEDTIEKVEEEDDDDDDDDEEEEEEETSSPEEEDLTLGVAIPEKLRARDHLAEILRLGPEAAETENLLAKTIDITLRELKRLYDNAIKPLEILYKYRDLSNRHFGDPEIFSKPLILFMGPWSGGKSSIINYLLDNEYRKTSLRTGAEPSPAYFNILMWGNESEILDGTQLAADWTFSGLQKFGQGLLDRLRGLKLNSPLLDKVNIVEIPGILEIRKQVERMFPFNDACQWFIDRADIIFLVYDPAKLDVGPETEAILDQLKGREYQTRIILNKADQVKPEELMRVQGTLIWNISPLMSSSEPPVMYSTSLWSLPYEAGAPGRLLFAQERAFLRDLREAIDKRVENKIASARRFAVRVRNHAKMVDCYLTTFYNHKSFFGNKKKVAEDIIEHPQNYHIYEGLSTLTNISRYDLPDPESYRDFFRLNPIYEFQQLSSTCTYFRGCPINRLDIAIAYDLPELVGKYKKSAEHVLAAAAASTSTPHGHTRSKS